MNVTICVSGAIKKQDYNVYNWANVYFGKSFSGVVNSKFEN